jgi:hypothetical protein
MTYGTRRYMKMVTIAAINNFMAAKRIAVIGPSDNIFQDAFS